jgi:hypothetical protein
MKISNIRILNNYKIKLINSKLSGVVKEEYKITEQGTRFPIIPTPPKTNPT